LDVVVSSVGAVSVTDTSDFRSLRIVSEIPPSEHGTLERALAALALRVEAEHAWLSVAALRVAAAETRDEAWNAAFDDMIEKGARYGFVDAAAGTVRAHIEWTAGSDAAAGRSA